MATPSGRPLGRPRRRALAALWSVAVAGIAIAVWWVLTGDRSTAPVTPSISDGTPAAAPTLRAPTASGDAQGGGADPTARRQPTSPTQAADEDAAQGVRGTVVDARSGRPLPGLQVCLLPSQAESFLFAMQRAAQGLPCPVIARTETAADGRFRLGVPDGAAGTVELQVIADSHVDASMPQIAVCDGEWVDAGTLRLDPGAVLRGAVVHERDGSPIAGALVRVEQPGLGLRPPGRELGRTTTTDASGTFAMSGLGPGPHLVTIAAEGCAAWARGDVMTPGEGEPGLRVTLPDGAAIRGVVRGTDGEGIAGARVQATLPTAPAARPSAVATTDENGRFALLGLQPRDHLLSASALDHAPMPQPLLVAAGDERVELELYRQAKVRLRVTGRHGATVTAFTVLTKTARGDGVLGGSAMPARSIRQPPGGIAELGGFSPGTYVLQVRARGYAQAFSDPFSVLRDDDAVDVEMHLQAGGSIAGTVLTPDGRPLAGAVLTTLPDGLVEIPLLAAAVHPRQERRQATTADDGSFRIDQLNPETYLLRVEHPGYARLDVPALAVHEGQVLDVGRLGMPAGVLIDGTVLVDGKLTGQVRVTATRKPVEGMGALKLEAVSDGHGHFRMPERLPPGTYTLQAHQATLAQPGLQIAQLLSSRQEVRLVPGQVRATFELRVDSGQ